jgi:hypothetical protein
MACRARRDDAGTCGSKVENETIEKRRKKESLR